MSGIKYHLIVDREFWPLLLEKNIWGEISPPEQINFMKNWLNNFIIPDDEITIPDWLKKQKVKGYKVDINIGEYISIAKLNDPLKGVREIIDDHIKSGNIQPSIVALGNSVDALELIEEMKRMINEDRIKNQKI